MLPIIPVDGEFVKEAVAAQLAKEMPSIERYKEGQLQNFQRECFVIHQVTTSTQKLMNERYRRTYRMRIHFFPMRKDSRPKERCDAMGNDLSAALALLRLPEGHSSFGREMSWEIVDNVLHFSVVYEMHIFLQLPPPDPMWSLEVHVYEKTEGSEI